MEYLQVLLLLVIAGILYRQKPSANQTGKRGVGNVILDSCALIDGRIIDLAQAGFVGDRLVVPQFVLHELQMLADGPDAYKRDRARYGLDMVKELQASGADIVIDQTEIEGRHKVDEKLVLLAKRLNAKLYTTDYNLNKVADIEGVTVLNVNELASALRPTALPGEKKDVLLLQKGSSASQAVGYLEDGTMVVVEKAARFIGKTVPVEISKTHQTASGKMLFAQLAIPMRTTVKPAPDKSIVLRKRLRSRKTIS